MFDPISALVGGGALLSAGVSYFGNRSANAAQRDAGTAAAAQQGAQYAQTRADLAPWRASGVQALSQITSRTQPGGDLLKPFSLADFRTDPGYNFRQSEGMKGINNSLLAKGGALSGAALKAGERFNQNLASAEYGNAYNRYNKDQTNQFNRLASLSGLGQQTSQQLGQFGQTYGQNQADSTRYQGQLQAQRNQLLPGAINGLIGQGLSMYGSR